MCFPLTTETQLSFSVHELLAYYHIPGHIRTYVLDRHSISYDCALYDIQNL